MYFTQDDYRKIEAWLQARTIKDTDFKEADPLTGRETIPIIQDDKNKTVNLKLFLKQLSAMELPDFFNVTNFVGGEKLDLEEAIKAVPVENRKLGLAITFCDKVKGWWMYQFKGASITQWESLGCWKDYLEINTDLLAKEIADKAIDEVFSEVSVPQADEEDITEVETDDGIFLKLKDKEYNPTVYSGKGRKILRKNIVNGVNRLTQDMINKENTTYIIQYDFYLNDSTITIPDGCTILMQGGTINGGTIDLNKALITGVSSIAEVGNNLTLKNYGIGQISIGKRADVSETTIGGKFNIISWTGSSWGYPVYNISDTTVTHYDKNNPSSVKTASKARGVEPQNIDIFERVQELERKVSELEQLNKNI